MSENNNDADLGEIEVPIELPKEGDEGYADFDWKAHAEKNHGIAQRNKTRAEKAKAKAEKPAEEKKPDENKDGELDKGDKALLRAEGIRDADEVDLVKQIMKETGKDLESVLDGKYFQGELKSLRDEKAADDAAGTGGKRSGAGSKDSVEYWLAKDELPPTSQPELRTKVVNAKIKAKQAVSQFSDNPVIK